MQKPVQTPEQFADMQWPRFGLDLTREFAPQRPNTTPTAENVRLYEPSTLRARGGARPGIVQYIPGTVAGAFVIQHINSIVDPQGIGLLDTYDWPYSTGVADPSGGGRFVRPGGSGRQPSRSSLRTQVPVVIAEISYPATGTGVGSVTAFTLNGHALQTCSATATDNVLTAEVEAQTGDSIGNPVGTTGTDASSNHNIVYIVSTAYFVIGGSNTFSASFSGTNSNAVGPECAITAGVFVYDVFHLVTSITGAVNTGNFTETLSGSFSL